MGTNEIINEVGKKVGKRALAVRTRTWSLTIVILITLAFYIVVNVTTKQTINPIDFALLCIMQVVVNALYFPDGELFGQREKVFVSNREIYNDKATQINQNGLFGKLRDYCEYEYNERKERYINTQCGFIGITLEELEELKAKPEQEIKKNKEWVFTHGEKTVTVRMSKAKRKILHSLIFDPLPIERNNPDTITSAVERDDRKSIKDGSKPFKRNKYVKVALYAILIGGLFSYISYKLVEGFGFEQIVQICMYITTMFSTAVRSFSDGETCSKVYKAQFYIDLINFIDGFNEWNAKNNA